MDNHMLHSMTLQQGAHAPGLNMAGNGNESGLLLIQQSQRQLALLHGVKTPFGEQQRLFRNTLGT